MNKKLLEFLDSKLVRASLIIIGVLLVFFGQDIYNRASAEQKNVIDPVTGELDPYYKIDPNQPTRAHAKNTKGKRKQQKSFCSFLFHPKLPR